MSEQDETLRFGWYANPPAGQRDDADDDDADGPVAGTEIRFMPDVTVTIPLWDEDGLVPEDPDWLERELGLSRNLIADLEAWAIEWDRHGSGDSAGRQAWRARHRQLEADPHRLFARLQVELSPRFTVVMKL